MLKNLMMLAVALTPAALTAQSVQAKGQARTSANATAGETSAQSATSVDAEIAIARRKQLPEERIRRRVAEGRAKGASEAQLALAASRVRANLEAAHEAMVRAGRSQPSDDEVDRGAGAIERGYTSAEIEAVVKAAPSDRSLVTAFDVLTRLAARGVTTGKALAQVQSRLEARATDTELDALVNANAGGRAAVGTPGAAVGGKANAAVGAAAAGAAGGAASATGTVSGKVGAVIKP